MYIYSWLTAVYPVGMPAVFKEQISYSFVYLLLRSYIFPLNFVPPIKLFKTIIIPNANSCVCMPFFTPEILYVYSPIR